MQRKSKERKSRLLRVLALALAASACSYPGLGSYVNPTAAVVGEFRIPASEVSTELRLFTLQSGDETLFEGEEREANIAEAQREVLTQLIQQRVALQEAARLGVTVDSEAIDQRLEAARSQFGEDPSFEDFLSEWQVSIEEIRERFTRQLILEQVRALVTAEVQLTEEEAEEAYQARKEQYDSQRLLAHILVCEQVDPTSGNCLESEEDLTTAGGVAERARAGEDFAALVEEFSVDPQTRSSGGELGWIDEGQLEGIGLPELEGVAFSAELTAGEISDPVRSPLGVHVFKILDVGRSRAEALEEIAAQGSEPKREQAFEEWLLDQLEGAEVQVNPRFGRFDGETFAVVPHGVRTQTPQQ